MYLGFVFSDAGRFAFIQKLFAVRSGGHRGQECPLYDASPAFRFFKMNPHLSLALALANDPRLANRHFPQRHAG